MPGRKRPTVSVPSPTSQSPATMRSPAAPKVNCPSAGHCCGCCGSSHDAGRHAVQTEGVDPIAIEVAHEWLVARIAERVGEVCRSRPRSPLPSSLMM